MATGCRDLEGALHILLALHLVEVKVEGGLVGEKLFTGVDDGGREGLLTAEEANHLLERLGAIDGEFVDHGRLVGIGYGHYQPVKTQLASLDSHG